MHAVILRTQTLDARRLQTYWKHIVAAWVTGLGGVRASVNRFGMGISLVRHAFNYGFIFLSVISVFTSFQQHIYGSVTTQFTWADCYITLHDIIHARLAEEKAHITWPLASSQLTYVLVSTNCKQIQHVC